MYGEMPKRLPSNILKWNRETEERVIDLINQCTQMHHLKQAHSHVISVGLSQNNYVAAKLVRVFSEFENLHHARKLFDSISKPNVFVWTALIRGYSSCRESVLLYARMHRCGLEMKPLTFTLSSVIKACANAEGLNEGVQVHAHAFKYGFGIDPKVQTTLVDLYRKCGDLRGARKVFEKMVERGVRDVQLWNAMIAGYTAVGDVEVARCLFDRMQNRNTFTWVEMIVGYVKCGQMESARMLFDADIALKGDPVVCTTMITGYAKCGDLHSARLVFNEMPHRDVAAWNAMISTYSNASLNDEALNLFRAMITAVNVKPNRTTISTIVSVCAQFKSPTLANWIQDYVDQHGFQLLNNHTVAALINLHSRCGDLGRASNLFSWWRDKDLICFSSMIAGFGVHGHGREALRVFDELIQSNLKPDAICFVSVLTACSYSGMVKKGRWFFKAMRDKYGISPTTEHYMCLVDMLGRAGCIEEAYQVVTEEMQPEFRRHAGVWGALLSACRIHSNMEVGEEATRHLMKLEPENAGNYVLMSNIYAKARKWDGVARMRELMRSRGMKKPPGCSWVEGEDGSVMKFSTGETHDIVMEALFELLSWELMDEGYIPNIEEEME